MDTLLNQGKKGRVVNKVLLAAIGIAVLFVAGVIGLWSLRPSMEEQKRNALEGAVRAGDPQFETLTKKVIIQTDTDRTTQSPTAFGSISMSIAGKIRNVSDKSITGLEVKVGVVDLAGKVIKEKTVLVVPTQQTRLDPNETIPVVVTIDGFDKEDNRANVRWVVTAINFEKSP